MVGENNLLDFMDIKCVSISDSTFWPAVERRMVMGEVLLEVVNFRKTLLPIEDNVPIQVAMNAIKNIN